MAHSFPIFLTITYPSPLAVSLVSLSRLQAAQGRTNLVLEGAIHIDNAKDSRISGVYFMPNFLDFLFTITVR